MTEVKEDLKFVCKVDLNNFLSFHEILSRFI